MSPLSSLGHELPVHSGPARFCLAPKKRQAVLCVSRIGAAPEKKKPAKGAGVSLSRVCERLEGFHFASSICRFGAPFGPGPPFGPNPRKASVQNFVGSFVVMIEER
jgi:hypothetical protein